MRRQLIVVFILILTTSHFFLSKAQENHTLSSPNGKLEIRFSLMDGKPYYAVKFNHIELIKPSAMGFQFSDHQPLSTDFKILETEESFIDEDWEPVWGRFESITNKMNEMRITLKEVNDSQRMMVLIFRAADNGAAFRYSIPRQDNWNDVQITDELTEFNFADDYQTFWIPAHYDSYEQLYRNTPLSELDSANTPVTMVTGSGIYIAVHEANLTNYAGMTIENSSPGSTSFHSVLVPSPDGIKVRAELPMVTPWRTLQITDNAEDLLVSNFILNLNEPNKLQDVSYIEPMKYIGIWWGMHVGRNTWHQGDKHGATTENAKKFVDYAALLGIRGLLIEGWNKGWENWGDSDNFDFLTPYDDFDLEEVIRYAEKHGITLIGHNETGGNFLSYEKQLDSAFALYHRLGIKAVKTGYAGPIKPGGYHHHGQTMVNHYRRVVEKAAENKIMIDAHEPIKPTGISRTYPNMMTREGVRGMEYNAWSSGNPPEHTTILPFTRLLGGPVDYTPGIFDLLFDDYKDEERVKTTLAKQLALYVVLYSPLQMAADFPENYFDHPLFEFIREVPVNWHDTRALNGKIGDYVTIAARNGKNWFIGSITDEEARTFELPLDFLDEDRVYDAVLYCDGDDADWESNPYSYKIERQTYKSTDILTLKLAPGGGAAVILKPAD